MREMIKDREAWRAAVHGVTEYTTERLSKIEYSRPYAENLVKDSLRPPVLAAPPRRGFSSSALPFLPQT